MDDERKVNSRAIPSVESTFFQASAPPSTSSTCFRCSSKRLEYCDDVKDCAVCTSLLILNTYGQAWQKNCCCAESVGRISSIFAQFGQNIIIFVLQKENSAQPIKRQVDLFAYTTLDTTIYYNCDCGSSRLFCIRGLVRLYILRRSDTLPRMRVCIKVLQHLM